MFVAGGNTGRPAVRQAECTAAVTFVIVVLGAVLAVFPATAPFGALLCLLAVVPAIVAMRRVRKGTADTRRRSVAALVVAPVFFVVAAAVTPHAPATTAGAHPVPVVAAGVPAAVAVPAGATAAPVSPAGPLAALGPAQSPAGGAAAPRKVTVAPQPAAAKAVAPKPVAAKPAAPKPATAACPAADHYVNSSGACVLRPVQAATAPAGATGQCKDGTYSSSQTRSGTCSRHGGVSRWLRTRACSHRRGGRPS